MKAAVLWDLDDTLLETLPDRMTALDHAYFSCLGERADPLALWRSHRGGTLEALGRRLLGDDYGRFVNAYREHYYSLRRHCRPFMGIEHVLETLTEAGLPMAVVTAKISWGAIDELTRGGILQHFQAVIGVDDTDAHKPDPEPIFAALDRMLIDSADDVLFVGDSPADIFAARNAGCASAAALWGTIDEELLRDAAPNHFVHRPIELLPLILGVEVGADGG
jgi:pyrophosphatase PpaX